MTQEEWQKANPGIPWPKTSENGITKWEIVKQTAKTKKDGDAYLWDQVQNVIPWSEVD